MNEGDNMAWHEHPITIRYGNIEATLQDDVSEDEALWASKNSEDPPERCRVVIKVDGTVVAEYARTFDRRADDQHVTNFLKKLLSDPTYRNQFLVSGSWNETVVDDNPVNVAARSAISRINSRSMTKLRFKDFASLKVGGRDSFSRMKGVELDTVIPQSSVMLIDAAFNDDGTRDQAKRWVARGLQVDKSIRKVKVDAEINDNAKRSRR